MVRVIDFDSNRYKHTSAHHAKCHTTGGTKKKSQLRNEIYSILQVSVSLQLIGRHAFARKEIIMDLFKSIVSKCLCELECWHTAIRMAFAINCRDN